MADEPQREYQREALAKAVRESLVNIISNIEYRKFAIAEAVKAGAVPATLAQTARELHDFMLETAADMLKRMEPGV